MRSYYFFAINAQEMHDILLSISPKLIDQFPPDGTPREQFSLHYDQYERLYDNIEDTFLKTQRMFKEIDCGFTFYDEIMKGNKIYRGCNSELLSENIKKYTHQLKMFVQHLKNYKL